ncbi:HAMP domain-containing sensor histidine kinase [Cytobacillus kochii]|uniref:HAMP domain-containing sensor histidine kinase n=1 Tax=Cytobacillus kochii TaxID=859143 RepID=UPI00247FCB14|nr:HAMP domain-containing sensor histidine kinase [Cytobacillus kochii]
MKTLYSKIALTTICIMLLSSVISFILSNAYYQQSLKPKNDAKVTEMAKATITFMEENPQINKELYLTHISSFGYQIFVTDGLGEESFYGAEYREHNLSSAAVQQVLNGRIYHGINLFPHATFVTGFFANELKNTVGVPFTYQEREYALFLRPDISLLFSEMHMMFAWLLIGILLLSILFVFISTKYIVKPIRKLNEATTVIANGAYSIELPTNRKDEIGSLTQSFMKMTKKLEAANEMRKEFITNISHDIQSPLSNIKGYLHLFKEKKRTDEEMNQMTMMEEEVTRLSDLTNQLLLLSSIDYRKDMVNIVSFNMSEQLKLVIKQYQWHLEDKGMMLSYSLPDCMIEGDPSLLYSVWENLLTNSFKYGKENGDISIILKEERDWIKVQIQDNGIGMNQEEMKKVFNRFYRSDLSRNRSIAGSGLGLSIVYSIVDLHQGEVRVESEEGEGTIFTIMLPKQSN